MKTMRKSVSKRAVVVSCLAAKVLGHTRVAGKSLTVKHLYAAFPAFNAQEMSNAIGELMDKQLLSQKGAEEHATYTLTDYGRDGHVAVA